MRKILLAMALAASVVPSSATGLPQRFTDVIEAQFCIEVEHLAAVVMYRRQHGTPLDEMLRLAKQQKIKESVRQIVLLAYRMPVRRSNKGKMEAVSEFGERFRIQCEVER